jgi:hypothetical protein
MLKIQIKTMNYTEQIGERSGDEPDVIKKIIKNGIGRLIDRCHVGKVEVLNEENKCIYRIETSETSVLERYLGM